MIETKEMSEKEYRAIKCLSYSMLSTFLKKGRKYYYRKFILNETVEEDKPTLFMVMGSLVDAKMFEEHNVEKYFYFGDNAKPPTGKGLAFCQELYSLFKSNPDMDFVEKAKLAYAAAELTTPKFDKYLTDFVDSNLEKYLNCLIESEGKVVISLSEMEISDRIVNELKFGVVTRDIFAMEGKGQFPLFFNYFGTPFKCKLDWLGFSHSEKKLYPYDLKCVGDVENFDYAYIKDKYYVQHAVYSEAIRQYRDEFYPDYEIEPFRFVVCDNLNKVRPIVFEFDVTHGNLHQGFETKYGKKIKGAIEVTEEILYHMESGNWLCSKADFDNKGKRYEII